ncbi:unnamed protein product [Rhizoctonia solani]|uniref:Uncharacterized protein n=1 Tax=Rhizoctonia solani TaxID=456999 RepID=A0A8H3HST6_9AGAM|nr:unnamed protein product [Rhizoctonia solani]
MTPPPTQTMEPMSISKAEDPRSDDPMSDSPHDGASIASSRSPSRLRRQVSNLSRRSVSGSLRRLSLLGPSSPPQVETASVHAQGEMQKSLSKSPSISSLRRHAASPEPLGAAESTSTPEPASEAEAPAALVEPAAPVAPQPPSEPVPPVSTQVAEPQVAEPETTQPEVPPTITEAPEAQAEVQPAAISTPPKETTPAPSVKAPSSTEAPKPVEPPQTPVKPLMSRSASRASLTRSPTPDRPEPKRRGTLASWARKSLDRRSSISNSPVPSSSALGRPPSRGPPADDDSDTDSVRERERKWGTGLPVPNPPTPKKSEDNIKRRFSLSRRASESKPPNEIKSPNESSSENDKKSSNWGSRMARVVSKVKKDKEKTDASSITPEASSINVSTEPEPEPRPSLMIPDRTFSDQRPLSAIVESPAIPLNPHMLVGPAQSPEQVFGVPAPALSSDSPVVVKPETTSPEMSPVLLNLDSDTSGVDSGPENPPAFASLADEMRAVNEPVVEGFVVEEPIVEEPEPSEVEQPKDETAAPTEEVQETPTVVEEVAAPEAGASTPEAEPETEATPVVEATATPAPAENLMSPMSPNSPASSPWDAATEREIARARAPRQSNGGPSTSNRRASPAPSIIGVKRKHPDEPAEVGKARVRYLPGESELELDHQTVSLNVDGHVDWAVSPAIQLAVTLSLVLPRRKRDVANPSNRKRSGWWPMRRGQRTEMRYNAIRGVNEEVPIASKSWVVPAAVRTTAKVVTAPARWMFHFFVPRSTRG